MLKCDLNCDMGEGIGKDEAIIPYITSANIACGYHAGDESTMKKTIMLANSFNVAIGAHPSFNDRANFGRTEIKGISAQQVYDLVKDQLDIFHKVVQSCGAVMSHVKPHGALYNMAARDVALARAVAAAVREFDAGLVLFGLSGSYLISEGRAAGLRTASEVFADRTYQDDGSLTPRSAKGALIEDEDISVKQVLQMISHHTVTALSGKEIPIAAETVCLHGDGKNAAGFAKKIFEELRRRKIEVRRV